MRVTFITFVLLNIVVHALPNTTNVPNIDTTAAINISVNTTAPPNMESISTTTTSVDTTAPPNVEGIVTTNMAASSNIIVTTKPRTPFATRNPVGEGKGLFLDMIILGVFSSLVLCTVVLLCIFRSQHHDLVTSSQQDQIVSDENDNACDKYCCKCIHCDHICPCCFNQEHECVDCCFCLYSSCCYCCYERSLLQSVSNEFNQMVKISNRFAIIAFIFFCVSIGIAINAEVTAVPKTNRYNIETIWWSNIDDPFFRYHLEPANFDVCLYDDGQGPVDKDDCDVLKRNNTHTELLQSVNNYPRLDYGVCNNNDNAFEGCIFTPDNEIVYTNVTNPKRDCDKLICNANMFDLGGPAAIGSPDPYRAFRYIVELSYNGWILLMIYLISLFYIKCTYSNELADGELRIENIRGFYWFRHAVLAHATMAVIIPLRLNPPFPDTFTFRNIHVFPVLYCIFDSCCSNIPYHFKYWWLPVSTMCIWLARELLRYNFILRGGTYWTREDINFDQINGTNDFSWTGTLWNNDTVTVTIPETLYDMATIQISEAYDIVNKTIAGMVFDVQPTKELGLTSVYFHWNHDYLGRTLRILTFVFLGHLIWHLCLSCCFNCSTKYFCAQAEETNETLAQVPEAIEDSLAETETPQEITN